MRRENAQYFNKKLDGVSQIKLPLEPENQYHVYQMYTIKLKNSKDRDRLQNHLAKAGIMTKVYFDPVHLKTFYKTEYKYTAGYLPKTEEISKKVLTIPLYPTLTYNEMDYIIDNIKNCCE